jgi:hypothetical protein
MNKLKLEVLTFKYLLKNIVYAIHDLNYKVDVLLSKNKLEIANPIDLKSTPLDDKSNTVYFDMFKLTKAQYSSLVEEYGLDITTLACCALDDFIRDKGYMPYGTPIQALKKVMVVHAQYIRNKEPLYKDEVEVNDIPIYDRIETIEQAKKYIKSIPMYRRNITKEVIELIERFNIEEL